MTTDRKINNRYRWMKTLSVGTENTVFLVEDIQNKNERLALKIVPLATANGNEAAASLREEFRLYASLRHPGILPVENFDLVKEGATLVHRENPAFKATADHSFFFIALPYIEGTDLFTAAESLSAQNLFSAIMQATFALDFLHRNGFIHRDIKPSNILFSPKDKKAYLLDFGLAHSAHTSFENFSGTLEYAAPEAFLQGALDARSDIYSLGLSLYKIFFKHLPFAKNSSAQEIIDAHQKGLVLDFSTDQHLPKDLIDFIRMATNPLPWERPQSLLPLITILQKQLDQGPSLPALTPPPFGEVGFFGRNNILSDFLQKSTSAPQLFLLTGAVGLGKTKLFSETRTRLLMQNYRVLHFSGVDLANTEVLFSLAQRCSPSIQNKPASQMGSLCQDICLAIEQEAHLYSGLALLIDDFDQIPLTKQEHFLFFFRFLAQFQGKHKSLHLPTSFFLSAQNQFDSVDTSSEFVVRNYSLNTFSIEEARNFLQHLLGQQCLPDTLVQELMTLSGGNLFVMRHHLDSFLEEGSLVWKDGVFQWLPHKATKRKVPASVHALTLQKMENIPEAAQKALTAFAIFPEGFSRSDLDALNLNAVEPYLLWGLRNHFLIKSNPTYRFANDSLRNAILDLAPPKTVKNLHLQRIHALQATTPISLKQKQHMAYHLHATGNLKEAFSLWVGCAREHSKNHHIETAIDLFLKAIALEQEPATYIEVALETVKHLIAASRYAESDNILKELETASAIKHMNGDQRMESLSLLFQLHGRHEKHNQIISIFEKTRKVLEDNRTLANQNIYARILGQVAMAHLKMGNKEESESFIQDALKIIRKTQDRYQEIVLECHKGEIALQKSFIKQAKQIYRNALKRLTQSKRRFETLRGSRLAASILNNLGKIAAEEGKFAQALKFYQNSLELSQTLGNLSEQSNTQIHLGNIFYRQNNFKKARDFYASSLDICRLLNRPNEEAINLFNLGNIAFMSGQLQTALDFHHQSLKAMQKIKSALGTANSLCALAIVNLEIGDFQEVQTLIGAGEKAIKDRDFGFQKAYLKFLRGLLSKQQVSFARSREFFRIAESNFLKLGHDPELAQVYVEWAELELLDQSTEQAMALCNRAEQLAKILNSVDLLIQIEILRAQAAPDNAIGRLQELASQAHDLGLKNLLWQIFMAQAQHYLKKAESNQSVSTLLRKARQILIENSTGLSEEKQAFFWENPRHQVGISPERSIPATMPKGQTEATIRFRNEALKHSLNQLTDLFDINHLLNSQTNLRSLLDTILDTAIRLLRAQRGLILLKDEKNNLHIECARTLDQTAIDEPESAFSYSIAQTTINEQRTILTADALTDERFSKELSINHLKLRSVLSLPLRSRGQILGAIYIDNPHRKNAFSDDDVKLVEIVSDQAALALDNARLRKSLEDRLEIQDAHLQRAREDLTHSFQYDRIIGGQSRRFQNVLAVLKKIEPSDSPVLILGEKGTGKELFAKTIHYHSSLKQGPFISGNCSALSPLLQESMLFGHVKGAIPGTTEAKKGLFELANGGSLYLKEIAELTPIIQAKVLRALQEGEVKPLGANFLIKAQTRLIASSTKPILPLLDQGAFRRDLYGVLRGIEIEIPPLRERSEDIQILIKHFLQVITKGTKTISAEAAKILFQYEWPGNVAELRQVIERAWTLADHPHRNVHQILPDDLPPEMIQGLPLRPHASVLPFLEAKKQFEREYLSELLRQYDGNITRAAAATGLYRQYLHRLLKKHNLAKDEN